MAWQNSWMSYQIYDTNWADYVWNPLRTILLVPPLLVRAFTLVDHTTHKIGYFQSEEIARPPTSENDPFPVSWFFNQAKQWCV